MTCYADLVVSGTAASRESHRTARKTFLYTDWKFIVEQVLKQNTAASVASGDIITLRDPAGC
jgi:hypothetical protein